MNKYKVTFILNSQKFFDYPGDFPNFLDAKDFGWKIVREFKKNSDQKYDYTAYPADINTKTTTPSLRDPIEWARASSGVYNPKQINPLPRDPNE